MAANELVSKLTDDEFDLLMLGLDTLMEEVYLSDEVEALIRKLEGWKLEEII